MRPKYGLILLGLLTVTQLGAQDTNHAPVVSPSARFALPDLEDLNVKGVRLSPGVTDPSATAERDLLAPGSNLSPGLPLPAKGTGTNLNEFVAAPIPSFSPTFGFGLALGVAYLYHPAGAGTNSPPWVTGTGAFYTENGSWGAGAAHKMNWDEDRWRLLAGAAYADLRYDFFGVGDSSGAAGQSVPLRQTAAGGLVELLRGVGGHWYAGGRYEFADVKTALDGSNLPVPPALAGFPLKIDARLSAVGLRLQRDTRDSTFYPTRGALLDFQGNFFSPALGSDFDFQSYTLAWNQFLPVATNQVLALRGFAQATSGDAPFFALASFGSGADLRGYTPGRYRDKLLVAAQAEYRWRLTARFGVVAFGGVGGVAPELGSFDKLLPSVGTGLRYVIAKKNNISFRFDVAWGRDEHTFYVGIGEAF